MNDIQAYNAKVENSELQAVCKRLKHQLTAGLPRATVKVWHGHPVWFLGKHPVAGYSVTAKGQVSVLFWSGQAFTTPGLSAEGSFKAADVKYSSVADINNDLLNAWLKEANQLVYNYGDIRANRGELTLVDPFADLPQS